jgi:hypothetical protein
VAWWDLFVVSLVFEMARAALTTEVGKEFGFVKARKRKDREDGSRWGWRGNSGNRCSGNGQWEVLDGDVGKQNVLDDFFKLDMCIHVLILGGSGILELGAYYISLLGSDISKDVKEVGQDDSRVGKDGSGDEGQGAVCVEMRDRMITVQAGVIPGVVGTIKEVLNNLVGGSDVLLVDVVNL